MMLRVAEEGWCSLKKRKKTFGNSDRERLNGQSQARLRAGGDQEKPSRSSCFDVQVATASDLGGWRTSPVLYVGIRFPKQGPFLEELKFVGEKAVAGGIVELSDRAQGRWVLGFWRDNGHWCFLIWSSRVEQMPDSSFLQVVGSGRVLVMVRLLRL